MSEQQKPKVQLTVSQILQDLQNGLDRKGIGQKYGLSGVDVKQLFTHPKLKNKKTHKPTEDRFNLVDDTEAPALNKEKVIKKKTADSSTSTASAVTLTDDTAQQVASTEVTQVEATQVEEKPEPTGEIKEVKTDLDNQDEATSTTKGLW